MWMALGADPVVAKQIMEMVMEKLAVMAPYADKKESVIRGGMMKVATCQPLAVSLKQIPSSSCADGRAEDGQLSLPRSRLHRPPACVLLLLQMTCGLKELLLNGHSQETVVSLFPKLFTCLLVRLGASIGVSAGRQNNKQAAFHVAG